MSYYTMKQFAEYVAKLAEEAPDDRVLYVVRHDSSKEWEEFVAEYEDFTVERLEETIMLCQEYQQTGDDTARSWIQLLEKQLAKEKARTGLLGQLD